MLGVFLYFVGEQGKQGTNKSSSGPPGPKGDQGAVGWKDWSPGTTRCKRRKGTGWSWEIRGEVRSLGKDHMSYWCADSL